MQSLDLLTLLRFFLRIRLNFMQKLSKSAVHKDLRAYEIQQREQFLQAILQRGTISVMNSRPREIKEWTIAKGWNRCSRSGALRRLQCTRN
jgi:hypothetical protein